MGRDVDKVALRPSPGPASPANPLLSRSGEPRWDSITSSPAPPSWAREVAWERADVFRPAAYAPLLRGAAAVVHSMGILLEADYKGVLAGRESPVAGLRRAFAPNPNPLAREPAGGGEEGPGQLTYEAMNRDSALLVAREAARGGVGAFLYVSAAAGAPILPARYISTKREAEDLVACEFPGLRGVFLRPPFMYDSSRSITVGLAAAAGLGAAAAKPFKVDLVAEAAVEALADASVRGPVEPAQIEELATRAWRKGML